MEYVTRVSGPISMFAFDLPTAVAGKPHRVYIFGDAHFSYSNTCHGCRDDPSCSDIVQFIDALADTVPSLDLHVEFALINGPRRSAALRSFDAIVGVDASSSYRARAAEREKVDPHAVDKHHVIGVIGLLYHKYGELAYNHVGTPTPAGVRVHAGDARREANARAMFDSRVQAAGWLTSFHRNLTTTDMVMTMLRVFLFSTDFVGDMAPLFPDGSYKPVKATLSRMKPDEGRRMHKIAKQFHKLPTPALKSSVRAYLEGRLAELQTLLREDLSYDTASRYVWSIHDPVPPPDLAPYAYAARVHRADEYVAAAFGSSTREGVFNLPVSVLLMDAYMLCRMLRYAHAAPGAASVSYTGDTHAGFYVRFLRDHMHLPPLVCHARRFTTPAPAAATVSHRGLGYSRCCPARPCAARTSAVPGEVAQQLAARAALRAALGQMVTLAKKPRRAPPTAGL